MCGAVSALSIYGACRTMLAEAWTAPTLFQVIAAAGVVLAMGWFGLLMTQTVLVRMERTFDHRRLGRLGAVLGVATPLVVLSGAIVRARAKAVLAPEVYAQAEVMMAVHLLNGLTFLGCLSLALAHREAPDFHRRWMLLTMLALVPDAVMGSDPTVLRMFSIYGTVDGLLLVAVARDGLRLGRIHRAYRTSLLPLALVQSVILAVYVARWPVCLAVIDSVLFGRV